MTWVCRFQKRYNPLNKLFEIQSDVKHLKLSDFSITFLTVFLHWNMMIAYKNKNKNSKLRLRHLKYFSLVGNLVHQ